MRLRCAVARAASTMRVRRARDHTPRCLACQARAARSRAWDRRLAELREDVIVAPPGFVPEVMAAIDEDAASRQEPTMGSQVLARKYGPIGVAAAAAAVAVAAVRRSRRAVAA